MGPFINYKMWQQAWVGSNIFEPLEDQQLLASIRRSELLAGHAISLNEKNVPIEGGGQNFRTLLVCDTIVGLILVGV